MSRSPQGRASRPNQSLEKRGTYNLAPFQFALELVLNPVLDLVLDKFLDIFPNLLPEEEIQKVIFDDNYLQYLYKKQQGDSDKNATFDGL